MIAQLFCISTFFCLFNEIISYCPYNRITVDSTFLIATDDYLTVDDRDIQTCEIDVYAENGEYLLMSITNFLMFSHRRPKNDREIIVKNEDFQFIVNNQPKGYQVLKTPITLQIPMNLNFRSLVLFTQPVSCFESNSVRCPNRELCANCSSFCIPSQAICDGHDSCSENESNCVFSQPRTPHSSYRYGREALSSSQIMLIGFFALNGSFIVFFLILSLCSAGIWFAKCPMYKSTSNASRHTFIRYLREAIPAQQEAKPVEVTVAKVETTPQPPRKRHSILNRINFQPAPALKELEPEVEDREVEQNESICSPPAHQPEVFLRRQSLPFGIAPTNSKPRLGARAMSVQH